MDDAAPQGRSEPAFAGTFPRRIRALPAFEGGLAAWRLAAEGCQVLFATYRAGTEIPYHRHATENAGVVLRGELILGTEAGERRYGPGEWYELAAGQEHRARFEVDTAEIELWFEVGP